MLFWFSADGIPLLMMITMCLSLLGLHNIQRGASLRKWSMMFRELRYNPLFPMIDIIMVFVYLERKREFQKVFSAEPGD